MRLAIVFLLCALAAGCGYGSKSTTPPQPAATPSITQLNPSGVVANSGSFQLEVVGTSFSANASINFNGVKQTTSLVTAGKLAAQIPNSAIANAGPVPVTVTNPGTAGGIYGGGTSPVTSQAMTFNVQ
ncbi:MAG TPA: hypothetical protein VJS37_15100 [Terriglobales bacterium]|jgi:hypothetical protein|nr:hypothetical protein [Terriglobales bacterium]